MDKNLDQNIIVELSRDGRLSNARLAAMLGVSVSTIVKRVNRLLAKDMITVRAIANPKKMGYQISAIIALDVDLGVASTICDELVNDVNISLVVTTFGRFDILLLIDFTSWDDLQEFLKNKLYCISGIRKVEVFFAAEPPHRYAGVFDGDDEPPVHPPIDAVDAALIAELHKNGRTGYGELALKLGLSTTTISRRVASLTRRHIIRIMAIPNPFFWGIMSTGYLCIQADYDKLDSICEQVAGNPNVHFVIKLLNGFDLIIGLHFDTSEMLYKFIREQIAVIPGINQVETLIRAEVRKRMVSVPGLHIG